MELLILKSGTTLSSTENLAIEEINGLLYIDFKNLSSSVSPKIDFIVEYIENIEYDQQMKISRMVHDISHRGEDIEASNPLQIFNENDDEVEVNLNQFEATYNSYQLFNVRDQGVSLTTITDDIANLPNKDLEIDNYLSFVFFAGLKEKYGEVNLTFYAISEASSESEDINEILAIRVEGNGSIGYYNLSYKKPYKGIALI